MGRPKLTHFFVKTSFEYEGYTLLSESYVDNKTNLEYMCSKGHKHSINWNNWKSGYRCPYCSNRLVCVDNCLMKTHPELSREIHPTKNHDLTAYNITYGSKKKIWWLCEKGHIWESTINNRSHGSGCPFCYDKIKLTYEFIKEQFEKEDYTLLSKEYLGSKQKLQYICSNGHRHYITWDRWFIGQRCGICAKNNRIGEGNPNYGNGLKMLGNKNPAWKGGISCEPYCDIWLDKEYKESIKERDNYECQNPACWGTSNRLVLHHIDYNKKNCSPSNLITVCNSCNSRANRNREWWTDFYKKLMIERGLCDEYSTDKKVRRITTG